MTALLTIVIAAVATWLLRVGFITLLPAERLPARVQQALDDVAPAVIAAILVTHLLRGADPGTVPWPGLLAALAAGAVAWRSSNLALPVIVGVAVFGLLSATPDAAPDAAQRPTADHAAVSRAGWADAALVRINRESMAGRSGVAEAVRFFARDVVVDDRAWSRSIFEDRDAWRAHLVSTYRLTLDEFHLQQVHLDPHGALVQQRQGYVAGLGGPANVMQLREYGREGVSRLRTAVSARDLQRRPGAAHREAFAPFEQLTRRYLDTWASRDAEAVAQLYTADAQLRDEVAGVTLTGQQQISRASGQDAVAVASPRRLRLVPGTDDPALYLDGRTPSAISSIVFVHGPADGAGCPGTVAVQLDLVDGRIARERRFHDVRSAVRCLDDLPAGWWSSLGALEPADVPSGQLRVGDRDVPLFGSTPELEELLRWALQRFELAGLRHPALGSITFAADSGRCEGIAGQVEPHGDGARLLLCLDTRSACTGSDCDGFTLHARSTVLHELAHAWDLSTLDESTRETYLAHRGLEWWRGRRDVPWAQRGSEQAAETLMWGLLDVVVPLPRLDDPHCSELRAGYRLLTGAAPVNGGCPAGASSAAGS